VHVEESIARLAPPGSRWRALARTAGWIALALYFVFALVVLALRYWLLPLASSHTELIERKASQMLGERVTIGAIEAGWQGLRPELNLSNVTVYDRSGRPALSLPLIDATVSWSSLARLSLHFYSLVLDQPNLEIRRDAGGTLYVAGIELRPGASGDGGAVDWLLEQREIVVRNGRLSWEDQQKNTPKLVLPEVSIVLRSGLTTHRFALRAKPPSELASALDLRGEFDAGDRYRFRTWSGRIYAQLDYADLGAWRQWIRYPIELDSGRGGVRTWLGFRDGRLSELTADVALAGVTTRLAGDLPLLRLSSLEGRIALKQSPVAFDASARQVALRTEDGVSIEPTDFTAHWEPPAAGRAGRAELQTPALRLEPLARIAEFLPLPAAARARIAAVDPRGAVRDVRIAWSGDAERIERYSVRGRFEALGVRAWERVPGFSGLTGQVDASERGGRVTLASQQVAVQLPGLLVGGEARLDRLAADVDWKRSQDRTDVRFTNIAVANPDVAGTLSGTLATRPGSPGVIDLTGNFSHVDGQAVARYVPRLPAVVADYLKAAVRGGGSDLVRVRIKGDLADFPFADPGKGTFQVLARLKDVDFRFAESWPELSNVSGELEFSGRSMRVSSSKASIQGVRVKTVRAVIPDLFNGNEHLRIDGEAEDQTADFLRFVETSPVSRMVDGFTRGMRASGNGRLELRLDIPIRRAAETKVAGAYQFLGNQLRLNEQLPPFTQVTGRLEFTEAGVNARAISGQFLGGPIAIAAATREGVITVNASGTAHAAAIPAGLGDPWRKYVSGSTGWQASVVAGRSRPATITVESQLAGLALDLPAPLSKRPAEVLPFRFERVLGAEGPGGRRSEQMKITLGRGANAQIQGTRQGDQFVLGRAAVGFNEPAVLPERDGISVSGNLPYADVDRWRALLPQASESARPAPTQVALKIGALDFLGKRFNDVTVRTRTVGSAWSGSAAAKEFAGDVTWRPENGGRIVARLKHFTVPETAPGTQASAETPSREMPALDVVVDSFTLRGLDLGRLELVAVNEAGQDWRIEKLVVANDDSTLSATGTWQSWKEMPTLNADIRLEVSDIGRYLERIGFPGTMRRGTATLEGKLAWEGAPSAVDYPTLSGDLKLTAAKGQFLRADPGVAKLLGILSLQSWATLDVRGTFEKGFAFESVSSTATISKGTLTTGDFHMRGPAAQVNMKGTVDLVHETQDLYLRVVPSLGDAASVYAILVNPVWGIPILVLQRILKDPLGQILGLEYHATGSWDKPQVERVRAEVKSAEAAAP
jgi:uncharacterized protein (TIGR02099 family)